MADMKELFETVSRQAPAVPDALDRQIRRQRRVARRRKVGAIAIAVVFVTVIVAAFASRRPASDGSIGPPPAKSVAGGWTDAGSVTELAKEGVVYLAQAEVFVIADQKGEPYALSAVSPHSPYGVEELLRYCRPFGGFRELEHGAQFDDHGEYMTGPASSGMFRVPTRITSDGELQVRPDELGAPSPRGAHDHADPDAFCGPGTVEVAPGILDRGDPASPGGTIVPPTPWYGPDGRPLAPATLSTFWMPDCRRWPPTILQLIDPLGTEPTGAEAERVYVADPQGFWADRSAVPYAPLQLLPPGVASTGYHSRLFELWVDPATFDDEVYLVRRIDGAMWIQRLPRVRNIPDCSPGP